MKKLQKLIFIIACVLVSSCVKERMEAAHQLENLYEYPITVCCDGGGMADTRSSFPDSCLDRIGNLQIIIYRDGRFVRSDYFTDMGKLLLTFPDESAKYNVYFIANGGGKEAPLSEKSISSVAFSYPDYGYFAENGFPMALVCTDFTPGSSSTFSLKRLVGEYDLTFRDGSARNDYAVKSVRLCNCAVDVKPFSEGSAATQVTDGGDYLSEKDISVLNAGGAVKLFFLENMQGILLPGNTDPKKKTPEYMADASKSKLCTYILVTAEAVTPTAKYDRIYCRCFLGGDMTSDFNIRRNTRYALNLDFQSDFIYEQPWRLEPDTPDITGSISTNVTEILLLKGYDNPDSHVSISVPEGAEYTISFDNAENEDAEVSFTTSVGQRLVEGVPVFKGNGVFNFTTGRNIDGCLATDDVPDLKEVTATISTTDGLLTKELHFKVYHQLFPIHLEYVNDMLQMKVYNPFAKVFETSVSGLVFCTAIAQKSQIDGERIVNDDEEFVAGTKVFTPQSGKYYNIDDGKFYAACYDVRFKHDVWYDHTWFGTSGAWRHSWPKFFKVDVVMKVDGKTVDIMDPIGSGGMFYLDNLPNFTDDSQGSLTLEEIRNVEYVWDRNCAWDRDIENIISWMHNDGNLMICSNDYNYLKDFYTRIWPSGIDMKFHFVDELGNVWDFHSTRDGEVYNYHFVSGNGNENFNRRLEVSVNGCCDWFWNFRKHK